MFLAVHASVGAIAGNTVSSPTVAFVLGFLSHFFMDMIPHGDENIYHGYKSGTKVKRALLYVAADAVLTVILIAVFFLRQDFFSPVAVSMGIVGGLLPDLIVGLYEVTKLDKRERKRFYGWIHNRLESFHTLHMKNHCLFGAFLTKSRSQRHTLKDDLEGLGKLMNGSRDVSFKFGLMIQGATLIGLIIIIL